MTKQSLEHPGTQSWRELYRAALFEKDCQKLPSRITEAEKALLLRARELFAKSDENSIEGEAIDDALYALHALSNCLKLRTSQSHAA